MTTTEGSSRGAPADEPIAEGVVEAQRPGSVITDLHNADLSGLPLSLQSVIRVASRVIWGTVTINLPDGRTFRFTGVTPGIEGQINVKNIGFASKLLNGGTIGFAESYFAGDWDSPDVVALLQVVSKNSDAMEDYFQSNVFTRTVQRFLHFLNRNTKTQAKRNIMAHYDLGNAFYSKWLDRTMTYSSAKFDRPDQALPDAQRNKYRSLAEKIDLRPEHHVLEIGSGWGGFAEFAASEIGCKVTGITISPEQLAFAKKRIEDKGLNDKVEFRLQDYRDVGDKFDRIASIEMFEAVGMKYWPTYFQKIHDCLVPKGRAGLQIITIRDERFKSYRQGVDFIQKYIFPGGMLPSPSVLKRQVESANLSWIGNYEFGLDYAKTLAEWRDRFQQAWPQIQTLGFDEHFRQLWKYYLSYCEAGFRAGTIDVTQVTLERG